MKTGEMIIERGLSIETFKVSSPIDVSAFYSSADTGISEAHFLTVQDHKVSAPSVSKLLALECPDAIISRVAKVIIFTLKSMKQAWTWPHISKKILKDSPAWIDRDATSAIVLELSTHGIGGPANHAFPGLVFRCTPRPTSMTVTEIVRHAMTAGFRIASGELRAGYHFLVSALTATYPVNALEIPDRTAKNGEVVKCLTGKIDATCSPALIRDAAAGLCMPTSEIRDHDGHDISAGTGAFPSRSARRRITRSKQHSKSSECLTGKTKSLHNPCIPQQEREVQSW